MFLCPGCSKYEEGPWLCFTKKENRIRGYWELSNVFKNGKNTVDESPSSVESVNSIWEFYKTKTLLISYLDGANYLKSNGSWAFEDKKECLRLAFTTKYSSASRSYEIIKFSNKELKLKFKDKNKVEWTLVFSMLQSFAGYDY